jgi:hypothetical protein
MKVNLYALLSDQIEQGLSWGIRRVYKYDDAPKTEDQLIAATDQIMNEIMNKVCEYLTFSDPHGDEG